VVFSRFSKKDNEPSKPVKPGATKPSGTSARPATPIPASAKATVDKIDQIEAEMMELDFTSKTASPRAAPRPAEKPAASPPPAKLAIEHGFNPGAKPAAPGAPQKPASPPQKPVSAPEPKAPAGQGVASVMMMEVQESPFEAAPVLEEAAILYANHQDDAAMGALEDAIKDTKMPVAASRQAWLLLFDLYENLGKREAFETAALQFTVRFETSPPAFNDRSKVKDPAQSTGAGQYFAFSGHLDTNAGKQFEQLKKAAAKDNVLRIEFSKIDTVSGEGSDLLLAFLKEYKKTGRDILFSNADHLIKLLNGMVETGRKDDAESLWLLLLDMYQLQNMQPDFEEAALNYCITYEVSPPSWVEPKKAPSTTPAPAPVVPQTPQDAFYLKGEIEGSADDLFKAASAFAAEKPVVIIDMFDVKRMDFIAGGAFLNLVSSLRAQGRRVEVRNPSPLINALMVTMGFAGQVAFTRRNK